MKNHSHHLFLCFFILWVAPLYAQTEGKDSLRQNPNSITQSIWDLVQIDSIVWVGDTIPYNHFDAIHFKLQNRYRCPSKPFQHKQWSDHTFFSPYGGVKKLIPRGNVSFKHGLLLGLTVGKWFSPYHALRLSLEGGNFTQSFNEDDLSTRGIKADYLFNLSAYLSGYDPHRKLELIASGGIGLQSVSYKKRREFSPNLHLGVQLKLNLSRQLNLFTEPNFSILKDNADFSGETNWHRYDVAYGVTFGLGYNFSPYTEDNFTLPAILDNTFLSASIGGQIQKPALLDNQNILQACGPQIALAAGKWLSPELGMRLSIFSSFNKWRIYPEKNNQLRSIYAGCRLEGILNLVPLFISPTAPKRKFDATLSAGVEIGRMHKQDIPTAISAQHYTGFTTGMQFKYHIGNTTIFIEPKISRVPYTIETSNIHNTKQISKTEYADHLYSFNIGLEIQRGNITKERMLSLEKTFRPSYFISLAGGNYTPGQLRKIVGKNHLGSLFTFAVGRHFTTLSSLRLGFDSGKYSCGISDQVEWYKTIEIAIEYMLHLNHLMSGYQSENWLNSYLIAGPVLSKKIKTGDSLSDNKLYTGLEIGAHITAKAIGNVHIFLEPKARIYSKGFVPQTNSKNLGGLMSFMLGLSYPIHR